MSSWTHVTGIIKADTFARTNAETIYIAQTVLNHLPKITGSEGDANIHVYLEDGYCSTSGLDEFDNPSNLGDDHGWFECQERVLITLSGSLRDRVFDETLKETSTFLTRLASRLYVEDCLVKVSGYGKSIGHGVEYVFTNKCDWLGNLYPDHPEQTWTNFLRWKPDRDDRGRILMGKPE